MSWTIFLRTNRDDVGEQLSQRFIQRSAFYDFNIWQILCSFWVRKEGLGPKGSKGNGLMITYSSIYNFKYLYSSILIVKTNAI